MPNTPLEDDNSRDAWLSLLPLKRKEASLVVGLMHAVALYYKLRVVYLWPLYSKLSCIAWDVIDLANTLHALGSSSRVRDALWFFRWSLRASEIIFTC